jgi:hypothetical protein
MLQTGRMVSSYQKKNLCGVALAAIVFGLTIACLGTQWYSWNTTFNSVTTSASGSSAVTYQQINSSKMYYDLDGIRTEIKRTNDAIATTTRTEYSRTAMPKVFATVKLAQAFVLIGLILSFIVATLLLVFVFDPIRNKVIFSFGMTLTRFILLILVLLTLASVIIAFLGFVGLTNAFKADNQDCNDGPCRVFSSSVTSQFGTTSRLEEWGPQAGWYVVLSSIPVALILLVVVFVNKFPLPIDSEASSGEAL